MKLLLAKGFEFVLMISYDTYLSACMSKAILFQERFNCKERRQT